MYQPTLEQLAMRLEAIEQLTVALSKRALASAPGSSRPGYLEDGDYALLESDPAGYDEGGADDAP